MTVTAEPQVTARERTTSEHRPILNKTPIHIALGIVALIWLAPTIGCSSRRSGRGATSR